MRDMKVHIFYKAVFYVAFVTAVMSCASFFASHLEALPSYLRPWISAGLAIGLCFLTVHLFNKWKAAEMQRRQRLAQLRRGETVSDPPAISSRLSAVVEVLSVLFFLALYFMIG